MTPTIFYLASKHGILLSIMEEEHIVNLPSTEPLFLIVPAEVLNSCRI